METQKEYTAEQWQMRHMLNDVVEHFSKDPDGLRSTNGWRCLYSRPADKPNSIGCAIGMYIPENVCRKMDNQKNGTEIAYFFVGKRKKILPKWMHKIDVNFLASLQDLHDQDNNWDKRGLSRRGKEKVNNIILSYHLPKTIYG